VRAPHVHTRARRFAFFLCGARGGARARARASPLGFLLIWRDEEDAFACVSRTSDTFLVQVRRGEGRGGREGLLIYFLPKMRLTNSGSTALSSIATEPPD
jgi:hypothetical protein